MRKQVSIFLSRQAKDLLKNMPDISEDKLITWFIEERKISIGGGDIIEYLKYLESKEMK